MGAPYERAATRRTRLFFDDNVKYIIVRSSIATGYASEKKLSYKKEFQSFLQLETKAPMIPFGASITFMGILLVGWWII